MNSNCTKHHWHSTNLRANCSKNLRGNTLSYRAGGFRALTAWICWFIIYIIYIIYIYIYVCVYICMYIFIYIYIVPSAIVLFWCLSDPPSGLQQFAATFVACPPLPLRTAPQKRHGSHWSHLSHCTVYTAVETQIWEAHRLCNVWSFWWHSTIWMP